LFTRVRGEISRRNSDHTLLRHKQRRAWRCTRHVHRDRWPIKRSQCLKTRD
jgi:hypothetical protein